MAYDAVDYLNSREACEVLMGKEISEYYDIHSGALPRETSELVEIHTEKLPYAILEKIRPDPSSHRGDWVSVSPRFASSYMTLLATHLSTSLGVGLLTDTATCDRLSSAVKLDAPLSQPVVGKEYYERFSKMGWREYRKYYRRPVALAEGLLVGLVLERIKVDPDTSVKEILKFRTNHSDELGRFRTEIDKLTRAVPNDQPLEALRQQVYDIYVNEVTPAFNSLKEALTGSRIKWATENFLKIAFYFPTTSGALALLGLSVPVALFAWAGVSVTASAILYN